MTHYTYIIQSEVDNRYYIGQTQNLAKRLVKHNKGYSKYTCRYSPWNLVWFMTFKTRKEAFQLELKLEKKRSRVLIEKFILENPCVPGAEI